MRKREPEISEAMLHGYVDGRLSEVERAAVEQFLLANPGKAAEIAHWQRQNEALTALFPSIANDTRPDRLNPHRLARDLKARRLQRLSQIAAAILLLVVGGAIGWSGRDAVTPVEAASDALIESAVLAHSLYVKENRHAVEVTAAEKEHLVNWLSNRVTQPITPPDLMAEGFSFVGGRLLPPSEYAKTSPAAQLMYENAASERVTVYITAALPDRKEAYEFASRGPHAAFYWANDKITCTVVGELPEAEMRAVAKKVYQQLTRRPDGPAAAPSYMR
ncbi:MAG TPA: anti-sigma factor [Alphaproteobacteria bacterium]|nr:anti-sigma factor [Alphaproteobacteria bacterium]